MKEIKLIHFPRIIPIMSVCIFFFLTANVCEKDECDKTIQPQYLIELIPGAKVVDQNGTTLHFVTVKFSMQKTHCDGTLGPQFEEESYIWAESDVAVFPGHVEFKMNNSKDFITVKAWIEGGDSKTLTYYYNDLKSYSGDIYSPAVTLVQQQTP